MKYKDLENILAGISSDIVCQLYHDGEVIWIKVRSEEIKREAVIHVERKVETITTGKLSYDQAVSDMCLEIVSTLLSSGWFYQKESTKTFVKLRNKQNGL